MTILSSAGSSPSVFGAQDALLDLADHYLKPGEYSTLKSGLFGYMTTSMAKVAAEGAFHRDTLYRENFLNTASLPRSIYNYAKIKNYAVGMSTPSSCYALVGLYLDEVRSALGAETGILTIPRGQQLFLGSTPFVTAGSIRLTVLESSRVSAEYDVNDMDFDLGQQTSYVRTYLQPQLVGNDGSTRTVVYMEVRIHQATSRSTEFQVVSSSSLDNTFYRVSVPSGEQLAKFSVFYKGPADSSYRKLEAIFNETTTPELAEYCFYSFLDDNKLEVYFSALTGQFRPAYNSSLRVDYLTSSGASGNFTFSGVATMNLATNQRALTTLVEMITQPAGGKDMESLVEVKKKLLSMELQRNNISIETDLERYLADSVERNVVNDSSLKFIKRRDDIQKRLFSAFLLMKDSGSRIVPTNTASLDFEVSELESRGWSLKPGTLVVYDRTNSIYRLLGSGEYPDAMVSDPNSFVYCIPFLMEFRTKPFPRMVYYNNQVSIDAPLSSLPGETVVADSFLSNSVTILRNSVFDRNYLISVPVSSNLSNSDIAKFCLMRIRLIGESGEDLGYVEASLAGNSNVFQANLFTDDEFDEDSNILLKDTLWNEVSGELAPNAPIPENIKLRIELYYNSYNPDTSVKNVVRDGNVFQLVHVFETYENLSLYRSLERVMASNMYVTKDGLFHCDEVPLVSASFFLNRRLGQEISNMVSAYHTAVLDIYDSLHNNTSVDVKFFNTYGPSKAFNLDRINISLVMEVKPRGRATEDLRIRIRDAAAKFVMDCNDNDRSRFSITNLTTSLETKFPEIAYFRFVWLNGVNSQNAELIYSDAALEQDNKRIPEFLNVATVVSSTLEQDPYVPDITVKFI